MKRMIISDMIPILSLFENLPYKGFLLGLILMDEIYRRPAGLLLVRIL